ncbi:SHOCT domain-containing protein [Rathayibacter sp. KR2-224]|uniref:SHOCT domain-containing protein n=1 Tax=Rathayibacter sp. KR2-224 TaxID=3400913 RepID=UPI003C01C0C3
MAARTAVVAGTATAVSGNVARNQQQRAQAEYEQQQQAQQQPEPTVQQQAPQPAAPAAGNDMMAQLQQLATMHTQGILTDDEFAAAKAKLLA